MDISVARFDGIDSQSLTVVSHGQTRQRYFSMEKINNSFRTFCSSVFFGNRGDTTLHESVPKFLTNLGLLDLLNVPNEYVVMNAEMLSILSDGNEDWLGILKSLGTPLASLRNDRGDSVLHLAATWNHIELVKKIISECPCLLLEPNSKDQLPIHLAARDGHRAVVEALIASIAFFSTRMCEEDKEILNPYRSKDKNGDTALKLALKGRYTKVAHNLLNANRHASFLSDKNGISPLFLAVEVGDVSLVKKMLGNDGTTVNLEGKIYLAHAALKSMNTDMIDVILNKCPSLVYERDEEGRTCLSYGATMGYYKGVCKLLDRSTKGVFVCDDDGSYPIHIAVENGYIKVVKEILKRCPYSANLLNRKDQNILHIAAEIGRFKILSHLMKRECLCQHLASEQDVDGNTPLHLATIKWRPRAVRCLVGSKNMLIQNNNNSTALDIAEENLKSDNIFLELATVLALVDAHGQNYPRRKHRRKATRPITHKAGGNKDYINALLIVAALIATVAFAAGFTLPGGTKDENPNLGMANLATKFSFIAFMVLDVLALVCSLATVISLIVAQLGDPTLYDSSIAMAMRTLYFAIFSMIYAFFFAMTIAAGDFTLLIVLMDIASILALFLMISKFSILLILQGNGFRSKRMWQLVCLLISIHDDGP